MIVNDKTLEAARLIARLYDFGIGCHLHVVLDDDNVEDPHLKTERRRAIPAVIAMLVTFAIALQMPIF